MCVCMRDILCIGFGHDNKSPLNIVEHIFVFDIDGVRSPSEKKEAKFHSSSTYIPVHLVSFIHILIHLLA